MNWELKIRAMVETVVKMGKGHSDENKMQSGGRKKLMKKNITNKGIMRLICTNKKLFH